MNSPAEFFKNLKDNSVYQVKDEINLNKWNNFLTINNKSENDKKRILFLEQLEKYMKY